MLKTVLQKSHDIMVCGNPMYGNTMTLNKTQNNWAIILDSDAFTKNVYENCMDIQQCITECKN